MLTSAFIAKPITVMFGIYVSARRPVSGWFTNAERYRENSAIRTLIHCTGRRFLFGIEKMRRPVVALELDAQTGLEGTGCAQENLIGVERVTISGVALVGEVLQAEGEADIV